MSFTMRSATLRQVVLLSATCLIAFFFQLGAARLFDDDEPKNAECGREMFERGAWIVPTYNYDLRTEKPVFLYWLMISSFHVLGVSEFSARLPSALMGTVTVFCLFLMGRRLFDERVGFWGGLILATSMFFTVSSRISTPDATLIALISLSLLMFVYALPRSRSGWSIPDGERNDSAAAYAVPTRWIVFAGMYALMGLAVLTKGPAGFVLPCAVIGLFLMCQKNCPPLPQGLNWRRPLEAANEVVDFLGAFWAPSRFFSALRAMRPLTLFAVVALTALPWYVAVGVMTDGAWLEGFLGRHNVGRFSSAMEGHSGPIFYYLITILVGCFPWSVFLPISLALAGSLKSQFPQERRGIMFLLCWAGVYVGFFSLAQTKLPNYVLPAYPPLALLTAWVLVRWQEEKVAMPGWAVNWAAYSLIASGVGIAIAFPIVAFLLLPGRESLGLLGLLPLAVGCWMKFESPAQLRLRVLPGLGVCALLMSVGGLSVAAPWISQSQEGYLLGARALETTSPATPIATFRYFSTNLPFYALRPIGRYREPQEIADFLQQHPQGIVVIREEDRTVLNGFLPAEIQVVESTQRFLRQENVLYLQRPAPQVAAKPDAATIR